MGLPFTPRKTKPSLILPAAMAALAPATSPPQVVGALGEDVVAVRQGLQVADRRQGDELGGVVLETLDPRALLRWPVPELRERGRVVGVGGDAVLAEVLEDPGSRVLRDPRVVHDVDVVLAGLGLAVLERLGVERVVRLREELHLDPGRLLEERDDRVLERREGAVLEGTDDELAARRGGSRLPSWPHAAAELLLELVPQAASKGVATAAVPAASPRRRTSRRVTEYLPVMTRPFAHRGTRI